MLEPTGSAYIYVHIGAAGGEDARALVPEHTDGPLGAYDSISSSGSRQVSIVSVETPFWQT